MVLSLNCHPEKIKGALGDGTGLVARLEFMTEPTRLGTAGAFGGDPAGRESTTVVLNGDIFTEAT